jgi:hypothetical protein
MAGVVGGWMGSWYLERTRTNRKNRDTIGENDGDGERRMRSEERVRIMSIHYGKV